MGEATESRDSVLAKIRRLEYFTLVWNSLEALVALVAGPINGSIALTGFGFDSLIEVTSGAALLWRIGLDWDESRREAVERKARRIVGTCFLALAAYIFYEAISSLIYRETAQRTALGIALAAASLIVMPILARAKRRAAVQINSSALTADARQADFCMYLSAILLGGLTLNALFGIWWADPIAALVMIPIIAKEGINSLRGESCCSAG